MQPAKVSNAVLTLDFLLFMEAGPFLPKLCRVPTLNRFMFDTLVRGSTMRKHSIKHDAVGPFQVTNAFLYDYLSVADKDFTTDVLVELGHFNANLTNIPLYQIHSVCGFLTKLFDVDDDEDDEEMTKHQFSEKFLRSYDDDAFTFLKVMYKRYYGAMPNSVVKRISNFMETYYDNNIYFLSGFAEESVWNV